MTEPLPEIDIHAARKVAARLAGRANLEDLRLFSTSAELSRFPREGRPLTYTFDGNGSVDYDLGDDAFVAYYDYVLTITEVDEGDAPTEEEAGPDDVATIAFRMGGLVSIDVHDLDRPFTEDEVQAYVVTTVQFALYPFAREYIYDVTGRLGLPALTIGVMKVPSPHYIDDSVHQE